METSELKRCLFEVLMGMVAPSLDTEERRHMLDCFFPASQPLDDETLDAFAQGIAPPPREFFAKWIAAFVDKALTEFPAEMLQAACADDHASRTRLYVAYLEFSKEHQEEMDRDLQTLRLECLTKTRQ